MSRHGLRWLLAASAPAAFAAMQFYVGTYEGWGQWAAAPLLLAPLFYGLAVALVCVVSALYAWRQRGAWLPDILAALLAATPWFYLTARYLVR